MCMEKGQVWAEFIIFQETSTEAILHGIKAVPAGQRDISLTHVA